MMHLGLLGHPVAHALSPALHTRWLHEANVHGTYVAHELSPDTPGPLVLQTLDALGWTGANLTVPFKTRVIEHLCHLTPVARQIGAVNTLVRTGEGWSGSNTDVDGVHAELDAVGVGELWGSPRQACRFRSKLLSSLALDVGRHLEVQSAIVLGAGGAARAVVVALQQRGCPVISVLNRSSYRMRTLVSDLQSSTAPHALSGGSFSDFSACAPHASVVVNTTTGPAASTIATLPTDRLQPGCAWIDLNYWMPDPPWLSRLAERGHPTGDGRRMLVHQGAVAFERFTGHTPDPRSGLAIVASNLTPAHPRA